MRRSALVVLPLVVIVAYWVINPAHSDATFPGQNGRISFIEGPDIFTMNPDGSDVRQVTFLGPDSGACCQSWSPDGRQLAFTLFAPDTPAQLWVINADGSGQHLLVTDPDSYDDFQPSFSPDGGHVLFTRCAPGEMCAIYRVRADGTGFTALTNLELGILDFEAAYSPDGKTIAFFSSHRNGFLGAIYLMNANGSNIRRLTPPEIGAQSPDWSPNGAKIAFGTHCCNPQNEEIGVINADGTGLRLLTKNNENWQGYESAPHDFVPSWSPQGDAIVFQRFSPTADSVGIFIMNRDGSGQREMLGSWQRPSGTTAVRRSLSRGKAHKIRRSKLSLKQIEDGGFHPRWGADPN
jgi:Tol biopolymer transport system component